MTDSPTWPNPSPVASCSRRKFPSSSIRTTRCSIFSGSTSTWNRATSCWRPRADRMRMICPNTIGDAAALPLAGEAFEDFFWDLIRSGVTAADGLHGEATESAPRTRAGYCRDTRRTGWNRTRGWCRCRPTRSPEAQGRATMMIRLSSRSSARGLEPNGLCPIVVRHEDDGPQTLADVEESANGPRCVERGRRRRFFEPARRRQARRARPPGGDDLVAVCCGRGPAPRCRPRLRRPSRSIFWWCPPIWFCGCLTTLPLPHQSCARLCSSTFLGAWDAALDDLPIFLRCVRDSRSQARHTSRGVSSSRPRVPPFSRDLAADNSNRRRHRAGHRLSECAHACSRRGPRSGRRV